MFHVPSHEEKNEMRDIVIYADIETGGLIPGVHPIIQLAAIKEVGGVVVSEMNVKIRPFKGSKISPKALEVNGITISDLKNNPDRIEIKEAMARFLAFCGLDNSFTPKHNRVYFCGYNSIKFDFPHLENAAAYCGIDYFYAKFHFPGIDVAALAADRLRGERHKLADFKLITVAKYFGVDVEGQAHDALFDVRVTRELYKKVRNVG